VDGQQRDYNWGAVAGQSRRIASALQALGLPAGSRIAIAGNNTAHWFMADFAAGLGGFVSVGLYPKQSDEAVRFIMRHSEAKAVFIGPMPDAEAFLAALPPDVIRIALPYPGVAPCPYSWDELVAQHPPIAEPPPRELDAPWTLIYTSGTTGNPKGVIITARNLMFTVAGMRRYMPPNPNGEHLLSYLPLAHAFERGAVLLGSLYLGMEVTFLEKLEALPQTLKQVRPTRFYGVPLVWTRFQSSILKQLPQRRLDLLLKLPLVSGYIKRKIRKTLGFDRCLMRVSGAAPLPLPVLKWFSRIGIEVFQGYGMTENAIYVSCNLPGSNRLGSVGKPFPDSLVRIADNGEILNKHDGVTPGYFKDPEKTAELFTPDGWLRTGDVGRLDADGYLYITGRVKEIFKTLKGKYVTPAPIEGAFSRNADIEQLCLVGAGLFQPAVVIALNHQARGKPRNEVQAALIATMNEVNATLEPHEMIAKLLVTKEPWTIDNGLVTPTMKVRRNQVEQKYAAMLEAAEKNRDEKVVWE
jgi:long-chain acyl-CoA synthetase